MKNKVLSLAFCIFFIGFASIQKSAAQCSTNASICTPGVAGPFTFVNSGPEVSSCLDWMPQSTTAYIILHINTSGPLNMLIDGNNTAGYLDVAVFNIPQGQAPCAAIQNNANELGCNYASAYSGCNQFGNAFACGSSVPAPIVVAGQDLMIVVENWQDGFSSSSTDFTLTLGPAPGAQTGSPNATVIGGTGPFCTTSPASQLIASDNGGTWSGPGTSASGMFNPGVAGPGTHTINYSIGVPPCNSTSTTTIIVNPPTALSISPSATSICSGQSVTLTASGASSYSWAPGGQTTGAITVSPGGSTTYTVTAPGCASSATQTINVTPSSNPAWSQPPVMCVNDASINLNSLVTGTAGGTWSGTGVSGNMFNPFGLSGSIPVTYTVGTPPCSGTSTLNITVNPNTPPTITSVPNQCSGSAPFNLTADITGGTWSGIGITNAVTGTFDPSLASTSSANTITYTLSGSCGGLDNIQITVVAGPDASWSAATLCANNTAISLDSLLTGTNGGTWSGSGVTGNMFNPAGLSGGIPVTYNVGGACTATATHNITVIPNSDPSWTTTSICESDAAINLNTFITGTSGGTWSGTGVSGNSFDPSGLSGNIPVTYTVGTPPCQSVSTQNINVVPVADATWTTTSLCSDAAAINLDAAVTGTAGGSWSGSGVTGSSFDPAGLNGSISVTYTVGPLGCQASLSQNITIVPAANAAWTTTAMCTNSAPINLNALITGTTGGTWSGTGVTGNMFDPTGLTGNIAIKYLVGSSPCHDSLVQFIAVTPSASSAWTAPSLCAGSGPVDLNTTITGTTGGTWSGTGVNGSSFNPTGLNGSIVITYTVGTSPCVSTSTQSIIVIADANATINPVSPMCQNSSSITLTAANSGGAWSGSGITNTSAGTFNPTTAGVGTDTVIYTIGGVCGDIDTLLVTVIANPSSAWSMPSTICESEDPVDLNSLVTGTLGGTFTGNGVSGSTYDPQGLSGNGSITYSVTQNGCSSTFTQFCSVDAINASFTATPLSGLAPVNVTTVNTSSNAVGYFWNFGNGDTSTVTNGTTSYFNMGDYTIILTAVNANGCIDTARIMIHIDELSALVIPNVFTPNGDGKNDVFKPVIAEGIEEYKVTIYDRWGLKMEELTNENIGWDGKTSAGGIAPDGVYYYVVMGKGDDSKIFEFKGFVKLYN
ncbi:MAG: hypothetical protein K0S44_367 [Bacteroidetes bacterium]|jgi:gliding motility-associated-like protein|nr:hypothetical protein [Bacteroidota bacterium]